MLTSTIVNLQRKAVYMCKYVRYVCLNVLVDACVCVCVCVCVCTFPKLILAIILVAKVGFQPLLQILIF